MNCFGLWSNDQSKSLKLKQNLDFLDSLIARPQVSSLDDGYNRATLVLEQLEREGTDESAALVLGHPQYCAAQIDILAAR